MTIEKGAPWGRTVRRPSELSIVADDAALVTAIQGAPGHPVAPAGGDLHRTLGGRDLTGVAEVLELPIDLIAVTLDDGARRLGCAHVVARLPASRGGFWRGQVVLVMNAEFIGDWHVSANGHPNDGRAESCSWGSEFGLRARLEARRRLPLGTHVPHPLIETRSFRSRDWTFGSPMSVRLDGVRIGLTRSMRVEVVPDAATINA